MKKHILFIILIILPSIYAAAQGVRDCYRLQLSDKNGTPYSIENPETFLSQRAIAKRNRFNIAITEQDLPINPAYIDTILSVGSDIRILTFSKWNNTVVIHCQNPMLIQQLRALHFIQDIDHIVHYDSKNGGSISSPIPSISSTIKTYYKDIDTNVYGVTSQQIGLHNGHKLHNEGFRGEGLLIAVLDAGWNHFNDMQHTRSLYENGQIEGTYNLVPWLNGVYNSNVHGTCCTSILALNHEGEYIGAAPEAHYVFIRSEDPTAERMIEEDFWARAAEIADSLGADIISSSLGYTNFDDDAHIYDYSSCDGVTSVASRAATWAAHRGIIVCVSAGNDGLKPWHKISRPSDAMDILCVGAVNADTIPAPFSSYGYSYDGRVKPDVSSCGWNTWVLKDNDSLSQGNGTSFAAPIIAGLSACLWQALPEKTSIEIMQYIRESGHQYHHPDSVMGYGVPDFYKAYVEHTSTGISKYYNNTFNTYRVYPNPCSEQIILQNPAQRPIKVCIENINGQIIYNENEYRQAPDKHLNTAQWPSGIYFVRILEKNGYSEILKVIKR